MRYFRDGVLKMIIKKVLPGDGSTFLYHNSGSFHGKVNPFSVVDQMKIHGNWRYHLLASHLSCTCNTESQYQTGVKLHGVFPSWRR